MARIETSSNLIKKSITLLDGTKSKIVDAIVSGYKVEGLSKRIPSRCIIAAGKGFKEIERLPMSQIEDTGEGYVKLKEAAAKPAKKEKAAKTSKPAKAEKGAKEKNVRAKTSKADKIKKNSDDFQALATHLVTGGKKAKNVKPVEMEAIDEEFAAAVLNRVEAFISERAVTNTAADGVTPLANVVSASYSTEFTSNQMQLVIGLTYALAEPETSAPELDEDLVARAAKKVGKKFGKKLAKAIIEAYGYDSAEELLAGTVLSYDDAEFIFCGASKDDADKAVLFSTESDKFRTVSAAGLSKYELVEEEEEEETDFEDDGEEEEEEEDEDEDDAEEEEEDGEEEEEDGEEEEEESEDEYEYRTVDKNQLEHVNKKVTAKYHDKALKLFNIENPEILVAGLVLTDGDDEIVYVGFDSKGGLVAIDEDGDVAIYKKADVDSLSDYSPVIGEETDASLEEEEEEEEEEDGEEESNDDFDFDTDGESEVDLTEEEMRKKVVELGLTTKKKAKALDEDELRELLEADDEEEEEEEE